MDGGHPNSGRLLGRQHVELLVGRQVKEGQPRVQPAEGQTQVDVGEALHVVHAGHIVDCGGYVKRGQGRAVAIGGRQNEGIVVPERGAAVCKCNAKNVFSLF